MELTPMSVQIRCRFETPPLLISDYALASALGLALQYLKKPLPANLSLEEMQEMFLSDETNKAEEKLYYLVNNYQVLNNTKDWQDMLDFSYQYHEKILR